MTRLLWNALGILGLASLVTCCALILVLAVVDQRRRHGRRHAPPADDLQSVAEDGFDYSIAMLLRHAASCDQCRPALARADVEGLCAVGALRAEWFARWFGSLQATEAEPATNPEPCASVDHGWGLDTLACQSCEEVAPWSDCLQAGEWIRDHPRAEGEECHACPGCTERDRNRAIAAEEPDHPRASDPERVRA